MHGIYRYSIEEIEITQLTPDLVRITSSLSTNKTLAVARSDGRYQVISGNDSAMVWWELREDGLWQLNNATGDTTVYGFSAANQDVNGGQEHYITANDATSCLQGFWHYTQAQNLAANHTLLASVDAYASAIQHLGKTFSNGYENPYVSLALGRCYYHGWGTIKRYPRALLCLSKALEIPEAQWLCARMYDLGHRSLEQDWQNAVLFYQMCSKQSIDTLIQQKASLMLGEFYLLGIGGLEKDEQQARAYFAKAQYGFPEAYAQRMAALTQSVYLAANRQFLVGKDYRDGGIQLPLAYALLQAQQMQTGKNALRYQVQFVIPSHAEAVRVQPVVFGKDDPENDYVSGFSFNPSPLYTQSGQHAMQVYVEDSMKRFVGFLYVGMYVYLQENDPNPAYVVPVKVPVMAAWIRKE